LLDIGLQVELLEDATQQLTFEQILAIANNPTPNQQQTFVRSNQIIPNFGNSASAIWCKFTVQVQQQNDWYLELSTPLTSHIEFYKPVGTTYQKSITGADYLFSQREEPVPNYLFKLSGLTDSTSSKTFYLRVQSKYLLEMPLRIGILKNLLEESRQRDMGYALYLGIMLAMALYNSFLLFVTKDKIYIYYIAYICFLSTLYLSFEGYVFEYFFSFTPQYNPYQAIHSNITIIFILLFASSFLKTKQFTPQLHWGLNILIVICVVLVTYNLLNPKQFITHNTTSQLISTLSVLYILVVGFVNIFRKNPNAVYFLIAWSVFIVGVFILMLKISLVLPSNLLTDNITLIGSASEVILLSLALGNRINILKREKEKAQKEHLQQVIQNEQLVREQNIVLEQKVKEKTLALQDALEEVKQTNEELSVTLDNLESKNQAIEEQREQIEKSFRDLEFLSEVGKKVNNSLDMKRIIRTVYDYVNGFMDSDGFGIGLYNAEKNTLDFDGYIENGEELPFTAESLNNKALLSTVCFLRQTEIIINNIYTEYQDYTNEIVITAGTTVVSMIYLPLITQNKILGVITVQSFKANAYTDYHVTMLQNIANYAATALENATAYRFIQEQQKEIVKKNHDILSSINYARRIQRALLPLESNLDKKFMPENYFVLFKPRDVVSGDFYWFSENERKATTTVIVADCTGHGVPGALLTMIGCQLLDKIVNESNLVSPAKILQLLHFELLKTLQQRDTDVKDGMDICVLTIYDKECKAEYAGAMNPIYYIQEQEFKEIKATKKPIGASDIQEERVYEQHTINLHTTTYFYLCTDGYQDQFGGEHNKKFMTANLKKLLFSIHQEPVKTQRTVLNDTIEEWRRAGNQPQIDDITIMGIQIHSKEQ